MGNHGMLKNPLKLLGIAAAMTWAGWAGAATLGDISVLSGQGQPLRVEIELISVSEAEKNSLNVRLRSPETYWSVGPEASAAPAGLDSRIERRPNGDPYVLVTSAAPHDAALVSLLVELLSPSLKMVREYIFHASPAIAAPKAVASAPVAPAPEQTVKVNSGDTLAKIANRTKPAGVSLERMLVSLYRTNPDAFSGDNMNRLKAGKILRVPAAGEQESVTQKGAEKVIHAQVADWNGYRQRVAGTRLATRDNSASRETSGKIGTSIDAQDAADHASPEVLKLSKGEAPGDKAGANEAKSLREKVRSMEEEMTAQGKSLQEKSERIALLEKNNREMQRLLELKSGLAAPASQPVAVSVAASAVAAVSAPLAASAVEAASAPASSPVAEPVSAPRPAAPPVEEPVVEEEDNSALYIGGGLLALLGLGGGAWFAFGRKKPAPKKPVTRPAAPKKEVEPEPESAAPLSPFPEEGAPAAVAISAAAAAAVLAEEASSAQAEPASSELAQPDYYSPQAEAVVTPEPESHYENPAVYEPEPIPETLFAPEPDPYVPPPFTDDVELVMEEESPQDFAASAFDLPAAELDPFQADEAVSEFAEAETAYAEPASEPVAQVEEADSYPNFDVPSLFAPEPVAVPAAVEAFDEPSFAEPTPAAAAPVAPPAAGSDFALDIPSFSEQVVGDALPSLPGMDGVSLDVADIAPASSEPEVGGEQWMNVATKLDLARAYQEMGDSAGAREILEEVLNEGDSGQRNTAELLLQQLSA